MTKRMAIDAVHPEETRVAVITDQQVDDFDFETKGKEQLRGNIYLAKVTRVEPSLQAAFVDYGGNRHGFLAFSEIHPDYYQLPQADREALLREAAEEAALAGDDEYDPDDEDDDDDVGEIIDSDDADDDDGDETSDDEADGASELDADHADEGSDEDADPAKAETGEDNDTSAEATEDSADDEAGEDSSKNKPRRRAKAASRGRGSQAKRPPRNSFLKKYKIQEVIRRRQVMLVQVVKEERGNKGAALTTYLSLAGRYSVLMPNTPRGGGISRKIANSADRKRLKEIMKELDVPTGMGLIVRTAGAKRTKTDIKRDYDYLTKLWDTIREKTLNSMAPCLINREGSLVHRALRDMFDKDIEEVLIEGEDAYREAKDLAKLIMPSQARKVKQWKESVPVLVDLGIEEQLDSIFSPVVQLKSGGYLVINQTEALVAIDVNSGKSTRARNIEQTALQTNLEAAAEACRQMRLRDLAGLIVIDFIDMDENKNNRAVEKMLKDCLKIDRARVQFGRISQFGLMEISRQRRRAGFLQATSDPCPACDGTGRVRSVPSAGLQLLRAIEARAAHGGLKSITVEAPTAVAMFVLNNKREDLAATEERAGFAITVKTSESMLAGEFSIQAEKDPDARPVSRRSRSRRVEEDPVDTTAELDVVDEDADLVESEEADAEEAVQSEDEPRRKKRRRGRRGGRRRRRGGDEASAEDTAAQGDSADTAPLPPLDPAEISVMKGEIIPEDGGAFLDGMSLSAEEMLDDAEAAMAELEAEQAAPAADTTGEKPPRKRRRRRKPRGQSAESPPVDEAAVEDPPADPVEAPEPVAEPAVVTEASETADPEPEPEPAAEPEPTAEDAPTPAEPVAIHPEPVETEMPAPEPTDPEQVQEAEAEQPRRRGWWSRRRA